MNNKGAIIELGGTPHDTKRLVEVILSPLTTWVLSERSDVNKATFVRV